MPQTEIAEDVVHPKSFQDLVREVHEKGICGLCGGCVSFCSAAKLKAIEMQPNAPPKYVNEEACLKCGICYLICPQIDVLNEDLNKRYNFKEPIGQMDNVYSAQARNKDLRRIATDGGVVTAILQAMLEDNLIDGALVCQNVGSFKRVPFLARSKEELQAAAGTHLDMVEQVPELGMYNTFIPIVPELRKIVDMDLQKIAVVGVPCQVHSLRKMQELKIIPAHVVKYILGLFCWENFNFDTRARRQMEQKFGFLFSDIEKINIKDDLIINLKGRDSLHIELKEMGKFMRTACSACKDFSNVYSDISFGGLGSNEEFTTVLVRNEKGKDLYNLALKRGLIQSPPNVNSAVQKSQIMAKIIGFSKQKQKRAEESTKNA